MVGNVLFANSYEHLEDQADPLNIDSYESLLQHLLRDRSRVLPGKFKRDRELIDFLPRIGHEASCKTEFFRMNEGFKSNMKNTSARALHRRVQSPLPSRQRATGEP